MKTVWILKGLPASGKSTYARNLVSSNPGQYKRINKDDLRAMLDISKFSKANEKFVSRTRDWLIIEALNDGKHVIIDDTNLAPKHQTRIEQLAQEYKKETGHEVQVKIKFFNVPLKECIKRDLARSNSVGEKVIKEMYQRFVAEKKTSARYVEQDPELPKAIICDIDGTLAIIHDRSPYNATNCESDLPNTPIIDILKRYSQAGHCIILFSGRDSKYKEQTIDWLSTHDVPYDLLMMRKEEDRRKDSIVKREMFDNYVSGKYYIEFVLDDRNQIVDMWRKELRLSCLQVYYGDF